MLSDKKEEKKEKKGDKDKGKDDKNSEYLFLFSKIYVALLLGVFFACWTEMHSIGIIVIVSYISYPKSQLVWTNVHIFRRSLLNYLYFNTVNARLKHCFDRYVNVKYILCLFCYWIIITVIYDKFFLLFGACKWQMNEKKCFIC